MLRRTPLFALALALLLPCRTSVAQEAPDSARTSQADVRVGGLRVSEDGRRLVRADGTLFFWLGDTAWELFHRLDREEARLYLEDRARKGFTVIQAVALAELEGLDVPNPYGETPLIDKDPARPNEAYFEHVDYVVGVADSLGLTVGMLPTWGDKFNKKWGVGPEVFTPENARAFGHFMGERYQDAPVIWILGGDRIPEEDEDFTIVRAMAEGIRESGAEQLMTYHPQGGYASFQFFGEDPWLDFNLFQSGHGTYDNPNYRRTSEGYALTPAKPILDGEPRYEDHPVNWEPDSGWFNAFDVRQAAYWSMLEGAAGHTYGNHNIWQMWEPGREPISSARTPWREALSHPGAAQMGFMRRLFESRPFMTLVPDSSIVGGDLGAGAERVQAARDERGRYAFVYTPSGRPLDVRLDGLGGEDVQAWWFDPRTGAATEIGVFDKADVPAFDPPGDEARGNDWLLVLDNAEQDFGAPGAVSADGS